MSTLPADSPKFTSPLAAKFEQFLAQKHAMGYRYKEEGRALRELDRFLILAYRRKILLSRWRLCTIT
jgi:hypothetical protein